MANTIKKTELYRITGLPKAFWEHNFPAMIGGHGVFEEVKVQEAFAALRDCWAMRTKTDRRADGLANELAAVEKKVVKEQAKLEKLKSTHRIRLKELAREHKLTLAQKDSGDHAPADMLKLEQTRGAKMKNDEMIGNLISREAVIRSFTNIFVDVRTSALNELKTTMLNAAVASVDDAVLNDEFEKVLRQWLDQRSVQAQGVFQEADDNLDEWEELDAHSE